MNRSRQDRRRLFKRRRKVGGVPGQFHAKAKAGKQSTKKPVAIQVWRYNEETLSKSGTDEVTQLLRTGQQPSDLGLPSADSETVTWINVDGVTDTRVLSELAEIYGLHPLAMEDAVNVHQRVKYEQYGETIFFVTRMPSGGTRYESEQVSLFLIGNVVISIQERPGDCLDSLRRRIERSEGRIRSRRADYLFYAILDRIIDEFFPILEGYDERLSKISDTISDNNGADLPFLLHEIREDLMRIRKTAFQYREALRKLSIDCGDRFSDDTSYFVRDCEDHIAQIYEVTDIDRETCGELRELYFALLGQKSNDISKVLTVIATVFIPMSFISGLYGMNFDADSPYNMPELHWSLGYPFALSLMALTGGGLFYYLYQKRWL